MRVDLSVLVAEPYPQLSGWIEPLLVRAAAAAGLVGGHVSIVVVGDTQMTELNRQYRGRQGTTDVLTFDLREPPGVGPVEADVAISLDEATCQSVVRGHDVRLEVLLYAVHGLLHLSGFDDGDSTEAERMHRREDELLVGLGFNATYSAAGRRGED